MCRAGGSVFYFLGIIGGFNRLMCNREVSVGLRRGRGWSDYCGTNDCL